MQRVLLSALAFAVCLPLAADQAASPRHPAQQQGQDIPTVTRRALPAVGLVVVSDKGGNGIAEGSGFLVSRDGKLVTNYHVIENAASAIVKFPNGAFYAVQGVLGTDKVKDLAVLKLSGTDFPFLPLGDSGKVQVGETVVAIGNPLALEATVSNLADLVDGLPEGCTWSVAGIGRQQLPMAMTAIAMGGHVRVGLEDNLHYSRGRLARNEELVARVARIAAEAGRPVATPDQARKILGLALPNAGRAAV